LEYGLVGMVALGRWLDLMIFEVFSNLWFYDSKFKVDKRLALGEEFSKNLHNPRAVGGAEKPRFTCPPVITIYVCYVLASVSVKQQH